MLSLKPPTCLRLLLPIGVLFSISVSGFSQSAQPREVAVTFDDLPISGPQPPPDMLERMTRDILGALQEFQAPAIGLVNESKLEVRRQEAQRQGLLKQWLAAGVELGNHTFSHPSLNSVPVEEFLNDIVRGERVTRKLLASEGKVPRYFRHPYLHTGTESSVRERVREFLSERHYQVAPVTLENSDWIFNVALLAARKKGDAGLEKRVKDAYLDFTDRMVSFFEKATETVIGHPIRHVLLLHSNPINAAALPILLGRLRERGYTFITLERALEDPVYLRSENYLGRAGVNWVFRWDLEDGERAVDWTLEPEPPDFVNQLYQAW